ncbi:Tetratricopeptide repeat protein, partial [Fasciola hepatica]
GETRVINGKSFVLCDHTFWLKSFHKIPISAIRVCQSILDEDRRNQRARDLLKRAQQLLKNSKRRDYYKILGVSRSASKPEILKAYRKLAAQWHPDKFDGKDKKPAEAKFIEIAAAKDVLTDPQLRARYDNGEDPLDPSSQEHHQGPFGPFGGFSFANMHPFEGGHFEFHFG